MGEIAIAVVPARWESSRFPGKPLALINDKPMIIWVLERVRQVMAFRQVIVATDDARIADVVSQFGGEAIMVTELVESGTDRVAKAVEGMDFDIVFNIQGDEPLIEPKLLTRMLETLKADQSIDIITACYPIDIITAMDENRVKVVTDNNNGFAQFFSRAPIPVNGPYHCHLGIYGYRKAALQKFVNLQPTDLEKQMRLEQLRALKHNMRIKVIETDYQSFSVDVPHDIEIIENYLTKSKNEFPKEDL